MVTSQAQPSTSEGVLRSNSACSMLMSDDLRLPRRGLKFRGPPGSDKSTLPRGQCPYLWPSIVQVVMGILTPIVLTTYKGLPSIQYHKRLHQVEAKRPNRILPSTSKLIYRFLPRDLLVSCPSAFYSLDWPSRWIEMETLNLTQRLNWVSGTDGRNAVSRLAKRRSSTD